MEQKITQTIKFSFFLIYLSINSVVIYAQNKYEETSNLVKLSQNYQFEGNLIGGLRSGQPHYSSSTLKDGVVVRNKKEFLQTLKRSDLVGKTIYIPGDIDIDLSGEKNLIIPESVTLLGDRGEDGRRGARLLTKSSGTYPLFRASSNARIIGLVIEGPDKEKFHNGKEIKGENSIRLNMYKDPVSTGVESSGDGIVIENCEFLGWTHSGVLFRKGKGHVVRYSYFHHNQRYGLGYGVSVYGGFAKIYANVFDYNRHDIAGSGAEGSGYEVFMNVFLSNTYLHSVDMHGGIDRGDGTDLAGEYMKVYNNYFERSEKNRAVLVRGVPKRESIFENNYVKVLSSSANKKKLNQNHHFHQINKEGKTLFRNNQIQR